MSTHATDIAPATQSGSYLRSRIGSFLAVFPLGCWTVVHLWNNLAAFQGADAWQSSVTDHGNPAATLVISVLVFLPLLLHTAWGLTRLFTVRPNLGGYSYYGNLKYLLQRLSAIGVLLFLGAHIWLAYIDPRLVHGHAEVFSNIAGEMRHNAPTLPVYVLGTLGVSYHLANGLYTFAMGWGLVSSREALRRVDRVVLVLFLIFLAMSWGTIFALWQAGAAFAS